MRTLLGALLVFALSPVAHAEDRTPIENRCAELRKKDPHAKCKNVEFGKGDTYDGTLSGPLWETMPARTAADQKSLIRIRVHFVDKIVASTYNLD